jgi:hypothetical protein
MPDEVPGRPLGIRQPLLLNPHSVAQHQPIYRQNDTQREK